MSDLPGDSTATSDRAVTEPADQAAFRLEARAFLAEHAEPLVERVVQGLRDQGIRVETGRFRAVMQVELVNDGPATLLIEV